MKISPKPNATMPNHTMPNEEKSPRPTSLTYGVISDWPEKCGKPLAAAFSRCFLGPSPGQMKTFFINKTNSLWQESKLHLIVKTEKKLRK